MQTSIERMKLHYTRWPRGKCVGGIEFDPLDPMPRQNAPTNLVGGGHPFPFLKSCRFYGKPSEDQVRYLKIVGLPANDAN